ncbi:metabolite:proton symporter family protein [Burkholderia pseudomallei]|uniref:MFS transporter n=1 Tax=Burkholderia pseudomallei TaxID=28450 RepID=UPI000F054201|nr:MFS transporter [Burkholderia pseudomallei]CAJ3729323.1 metabolite:proton symporter family protein [Burkholderia pseudomallei]CAJ4409960.1 metabolite:proton symporter family protein [Burkholderia pseudomallei]CAJ4620296.1 metabolite:proton symporter family protein [Burkholderia pseudomallei]CAJ5452077.1 metabolite:proton symporter family protein [Burkholderia pseudomallei]CAJ6385803.1 metabolite:proton symporter family protein [Burkholderia pseudomallei]
MSQVRSLATAPHCPPAGTLARLRSIFSGSVGNLIEYYDWYVYSAFSLYFAKVFFPSGSQTVQLLNTAAIFAVGFVMRPIGGWLVGLYADRKGRKAALLVSVLAMCAGSLIIGLTPGYGSIGIAAPVLLVLARLLQGLSLGGEYASSATYLSEMADKTNRGFYSSFLFATLSLGQLLAMAVLVALQQFFLSAAQLESWGWRIPFLIGSLAAGVAIFLRRNMEETESFEQHRQSRRSRTSVAELFRHKRACLIVAGLTLGGTVAFYAYTTYMQKFLVNSAGMSKADASMVSVASLIAFVLMQPVFGSLSDRVGRRPLLIAFGVLGTLCTVPIFSALTTVRTMGGALALISAALLIVSLYSSVSAVAKAELFPVEIRALGVELPYAITVSLFGGTAEYIALWTKSIGHETWFFWYVSGCVLVSLLCYLWMPDPKTVSCIDRD